MTHDRGQIRIAQIALDRLDPKGFQLGVVPARHTTHPSAAGDELFDQISA
jgi:hypothetical protein